MKQPGGRQLIMIVFCVGVLIGTLIANLLPNVYLPSVASLLADMDALLHGPKAAYSGYFSYLLRIRMLPIIVIWASLFSPYGMECLCLAALWYGICMGAVLSGAVLLSGLGGILIFLAAVLPQYIFYILIFLLLILKQEQKGRAKYGQAIRAADEVRFLLIVSVLFLAGVLLEAYLSPLILRLVARLA